MQGTAVRNRPDVPKVRPGATNVAACAAPRCDAAHVAPPPPQQQQQQQHAAHHTDLKRGRGATDWGRRAAHRTKNRIRTAALAAGFCRPRDRRSTGCSVPPIRRPRRSSTRASHDGQSGPRAPNLIRGSKSSPVARRGSILQRAASAPRIGCFSIRLRRLIRQLDEWQLCPGPEPRRTRRPVAAPRPTGHGTRTAVPLARQACRARAPQILSGVACYFERSPWTDQNEDQPFFHPIRTGTAAVR